MHLSLLLRGSRHHPPSKPTVQASTCVVQCCATVQVPRLIRAGWLLPLPGVLPIQAGCCWRSGCHSLSHAVSGPAGAGPAPTHLVDLANEEGRAIGGIVVDGGPHVVQANLRACTPAKEGEGLGALELATAPWPGALQELGPVSRAWEGKPRSRQDGSHTPVNIKLIQKRHCYDLAGTKCCQVPPALTLAWRLLTVHAV